MQICVQLWIETFQRSLMAADPASFFPKVKGSKTLACTNELDDLFALLFSYNEDKQLFAY